HWLHGVAGTASLLRGLYELPVMLDGWALSHAHCLANRAAWQCHAEYDRQDPTTDNDRFLAAAPERWKVEFTPLERAQAHWSVATLGSALDRVHINTSDHNERQLFSQLQQVRPALPHI